ncbi:hypothetical protein JHK85_024378 [Glycine max]|uniref:Uncharacterized protein n=1 Tax=Glycine soja TaxID=3848 RepID=A0A0B2QNJ0_GLYSO|nr:hypothetical protein JHK85_024378 [Glycine max]KAG5011625.1 hypothetical protein JHK86_023886 [Glycine max]KHN23011.1 hypothetical protein glysoja_030681 [Glycine soja]
MHKTVVIPCLVYMARRSIELNEVVETVASYSCFQSEIVWFRKTSKYQNTNSKRVNAMLKTQRQAPTFGQN